MWMIFLNAASDEIIDQYVSYIVGTRNFEIAWKLKIFVTSDYASPGFATWRIGGFGVFCHFGDFFGPFWSLDNLW